MPFLRLTANIRLALTRASSFLSVLALRTSQPVAFPVTAASILLATQLLPPSPHLCRWARSACHPYSSQNDLVIFDRAVCNALLMQTTAFERPRTVTQKSIECHCWVQEASSLEFSETPPILLAPFMHLFSVSIRGFRKCQPYSAFAECHVAPIRFRHPCFLPHLEPPELKTTSSHHK